MHTAQPSTDSQPRPPSGVVTTYRQEPTGTCYHDATPSEVVRVLERARIDRTRLRVFYGDTDTGRCWNDEFHTQGTLSRSRGPVKVPLLMATARSVSGLALLDHCIVRIQAGRRVLYTHPGFQVGVTEIRRGDLREYPWEVWIDGDAHARFVRLTQARRYMDFIHGRRNSK